MTPDFSPSEFAAQFQRFLEFVNAQAPPPAPPGPLLNQRILGFLQAESTSLSVLAEHFLERDLPNVQRAFDHYLAGPERTAELVGYTVEYEMPNFGLATILQPNRYQPVLEGPVQHRSVELAGGERLHCLAKGVYLINEEGAKAVVLVRWNDQSYGVPPVHVEVMCLAAERAEALLAEIRRLAHEHNVYRGQVISLGAKEAEDVRFHDLPAIERGAIILPASLLEAVERNTLGFAEQAPRLRAAGRHIRRGLLFHGPPGTGKTLTIMYLASQMRGRTVILLTGRIMGLIGQSCRLARLLAPALVVLEDVDLVAQERGSEQAHLPLLFELLNEMDGLSADSDVMFILSTNRPDLLEPALAARPGRIDQAIEFPLPDAESRRRLFGLYGQGLNLQAGHLEAMVERTEGASPAFIRELLRKAALLAAQQSPSEAAIPPVTDEHLREALRGILAEGGQFTLSLLGVQPGALE
jgi:hypothetical protein